MSSFLHARNCLHAVVTSNIDSALSDVSRQNQSSPQSQLQCRVHLSSSLIGWAISQQYPERQEWPDRNELLVREVFLRERQAFDEGPSLGHVLTVHQEDDTLAVAACEPLLDLAVEIQWNGRTNFGGHDFHDLLDGSPRFWRKDRQHGGDLGLRRCGLTLRQWRQDDRER